MQMAKVWPSGGRPDLGLMSCEGGGYQAAAGRVAASRRASARSVASQVKSSSSRPKWPYAAVWA